MNAVPCRCCVIEYQKSHSGTGFERRADARAFSIRIVDATAVVDDLFNCLAQFIGATSSSPLLRS